MLLKPYAKFYEGRIVLLKDKRLSAFIVSHPFCLNRPSLPLSVSSISLQYSYTQKNRSRSCKCYIQVKTIFKMFYSPIIIHIKITWHIISFRITKMNSTWLYTYEINSVYNNKDSVILYLFIPSFTADGM